MDSIKQATRVASYCFTEQMASDILHNEEIKRASKANYSVACNCVDMLWFCSETLFSLFSYCRLFAELLTAWDGCQKYFYQSWARNTALQTVLQHAAKVRHAQLTLVPMN